MDLNDFVYDEIPNKRIKKGEPAADSINPTSICYVERTEKEMCKKKKRWFER
jgi:hypothetical protein